MKKLLFLIFAISYTLLFSQKTEKYSGIITLENGTPIMFEMEFIQDKGIVNGFSITGKEAKDDFDNIISVIKTNLFIFIFLQI